MEGFFTDKEQAIKFLKEIDFTQFAGISISTKAIERKNKYDSLFDIDENTINTFNEIENREVNRLATPDYSVGYGGYGNGYHWPVIKSSKQENAANLMSGILDKWIYSNPEVKSMELSKSIYGDKKSSAYWNIPESVLESISKKGSRPFVHEFMERPVAISGTNPEGGYPNITFDNVWIFEDGNIETIKTWKDALTVLCNLSESFLSIAKTRENYGY